jgi:adenylate cyclase
MVFGCPGTLRLISLNNAWSELREALMSLTSDGQEIIDISADLRSARTDRRHAVLRIGVPILGVVLVIAVIVVISIETTRANRRGALELADDVLAATDARIAEEVTNYFAGPVRALQEGATLSRHEHAGEARRALVEYFSMGVMEHVAQIADFIIGDTGGNFMMFRRDDHDGIDTKLIQNEPGPRKVVWIRRNAAGAEIGRDEDPTDTYDPRTRSWYLSITHKLGPRQSHVADRREPSRSFISNRAHETGLRKESSAIAM